MTLFQTTVALQSTLSGRFFLQRKESLWQLGSSREVEIFTPITDILDELESSLDIKISSLTCISTSRKNFHLFHSWVEVENAPPPSVEGGWYSLFDFPKGDFHHTVDWILENDHFLQEIISPPS